MAKQRVASTDARSQAAARSIASQSTRAPAVGLDVKRVQTSYMQVADQLRDLITRGDLAVGQRLPSEAELAPLFGVSKSTIREALRILVTDGLVETRRVGRETICTLRPEAFGEVAAREREILGIAS